MSVRDLNYRAAVGKATQTSATRMPSPEVWGDCPWFELQQGNKDGFAYFDDLLGNYTQAASVVAASSTLDDPWRGFTDSTGGATIAAGVSPTDAIGTMVLNSTTAQEGCIVSLFSGNNTTCPITLGGGAGALTSATNLWFEARVKVEHVTTQYASMFLGLGVVGRTITLGMLATGGAAMAAVDGVGFLYKAAATTSIGTTTSNGTATDVNTSAATLAADTYIKLGMIWNGTTLTFYQNGTAISTTLTTSSTQFPAGAALVPYWQMICGSDGTTTSATMDWIKLAFIRTL